MLHRWMETRSVREEVEKWSHKACPGFSPPTSLSRFSELTLTLRADLDMALSLLLQTTFTSVPPANARDMREDAEVRECDEEESSTSKTGVGGQGCRVRACVCVCVCVCV